ncbi:ketopantoate reductase [Natronoarchaeum philippinense]|uniref:2-dehydropantoate 2-reductase n=1 Tax=Natronoarchaeum philippinense TaxID=558529 RepID=A0A285P014_NATPI|nr:2-dehydropantoate 2-reductase [Natronoarchaeum philippinense]SNZ15065.1 ketopantoate reductase [Natronoarchaeum philippinense]
MEIVVFGAGSLGSLLGGLLAREHEVTLVGRDPHVRTVAESGLVLSNRVADSVNPDATTDGRGLDADVAVVTVKSYDTEQAARTLETGSFDAVLSLQNGLGNEERLAAHLDCPVLAGTATYGARLVDPGHVECTGVGEIVLGPTEGGASTLADHVAEAFDDAGIRTRVAGDMPRRLWEKLAVNAGINPVTALARVRNGALDGGPIGGVARSAARETARTARAEGVELSDDAALEALETVIETTAENRSSMRQDIETGRRTEVDAVSGAVVDRAADHGLDVPTNETLAGLVRGWERSQGLREESYQ